MSGQRVTDQIQGKTLTIREVFYGRRYGLDSYQREYAWTEKQVEELINDLTGRFVKEWSPQHELLDVARYQPYFLGPVITSGRDGVNYLIDGQQRLTTLMLLLIWLRRIQDGREDAVDSIDNLVFISHYGQKVFAVEDEERRPCLQAMLRGTEFDTVNASASVRNLWDRFADIEKHFPEDLRDEELPYFIYWLLDRVTLVEISTGDSGLALEIFETMNDRGLRLTGLDMLKSFMLAKVDADDRDVVNQVWRSRLTDLSDIDPGAHSAFVKAWLRAKHSAGSDDDEGIGSAFDKWVRKHEARLDLDRPAGARQFVLRDMDHLAKRYRELLLASRHLTPGLEPLYYNAYNSVTLQLPLILATLSVDDDDVTFRRKANLVAGYLDIFVARCMVNAHDFRYTAVEHRLFALAREIREMDADTLAKRLGEEVAAIPDSFEAVSSFSLRPRNRTYVKYILARMASWLDQQCRTGHTFADYTRSGKDQPPFEIEHIWADKFSYQPTIPRRKFADLRNRFGALLLLPKDFNASFGDMPYAKKLPHYMGQHLLVRSLHPDCYQNNPTFLRTVEAHNLPFTPFADEFDPAAIDSRQELYRRLCELVWKPEQYGLVVPEIAPQQPKERTRVRFDVSLRDLMEKGQLTAGAQLVGAYRGTDYRAVLTDKAKIRVESGEEFEAASPAAAAVLEKQSWNGWMFWQVQEPDGALRLLDDLRKRALNQGSVAGDD
ncbi:DUF262 domain-containing protein [Dactylosporangium fulvum]|uniref:DUF262 domain-containing protein n=1 Tax=Dactylosporangium fulvum TaxID=53359 RepID=A0ABY5W398_9ACTN|nr:DUF262 domain-containing protein [Dactylosporangium fulvum]UWP84430.1 DUF262 domain-containing protein [Dactylosporangium fulvum]